MKWGVSGLKLRFIKAIVGNKFLNFFSTINDVSFVHWMCVNSYVYAACE